MSAYNPLDFCPTCMSYVGDFTHGGFEREDGQRGHRDCDALGFIAITMSANEHTTTTWTNDEVMALLRDVEATLIGDPIGVERVERDGAVQR